MIRARFFVIAAFQIVLSIAGAASTEKEALTMSVEHDASAEDMKEAILSLTRDSLGHSAGELKVSRENYGAKGAQAFRCD